MDKQEIIHQINIGISNNIYTIVHTTNENAKKYIVKNCREIDDENIELLLSDDSSVKIRYEDIFTSNHEKNIPPKKF
ncbi:hypothetical protein QJ785_03455 [Staphylococcus warneri]|uniref:hypothetical protein n=1 Tax=Staphylococcus warneri TaxID=1292 RepID=UPI0034CF9F63